MISKAENRVIFIAGYFTQHFLNKFSLHLPSNVTLLSPVGYFDFLNLVNLSCGIISDSGTVIEEASILGKPSIQVRKSTERPQVYDVKSSVKFDPTVSSNHLEIWNNFNKLRGTTWQHPFGDGFASKRIVEDILQANSKNDFAGHDFQKYLPQSRRAYFNDL